MSESSIHISAQPTPNPNTLKFVVNTVLLDEGTANFPNKESAVGSPLAEDLFKHPEVSGVFIGMNFISITKTQGADWTNIVGSFTDDIRRILASGVKLVATTTPSVASTGDASQIEQKIRDILDRDIRPAVAMDGGDITFHSYANGVVTLHLQGACSSCPSSLFTLRMGVESRLRELIPEVREVVNI